MTNLTINGKDYNFKPISREDSIVELLCMEDLESKFEFDDLSAIYKDSDIDNLLQEFTHPDFIATPYSQTIEHINEDGSLISVDSIPVGERFAYLLTARDIVDMDDTELLDLFWDGDYTKMKESPCIWLGSMMANDAVVVYNGLEGKMELCCCDDLCAVRPVVRVYETSLKEHQTARGQMN